MRLKNEPPMPPKEVTVFAGCWSVMVDAVTSCKRLSRGSASLTMDLGTKIVMLPLAPRVEVQFAAGN